MPLPSPAPSAALPAPRLAVHRSRHLMAPFRVLRPGSFALARRILDEDPHAVPMAGGLDLVNRMKTGGGPATVVWLGGIAGADAIARAGDELVLGATCRHDQLAQSPLARAAFPDLAAVWASLATIRIRSQGSLVGNLMADVPAYEAAGLLMAIGATVSVLLPGGHAAALPVTALGDAAGAALPLPGLVTAIRIPLPGPERMRRLIYDRSLRPALAVALSLDVTAGMIGSARAVLGGCHPRPLVRTLPVDGMAPNALPRDARALAEAVFGDLPPPTVPWAGEADYRPRMAPLLLSRLLQAAAR